jgi:hypothetical protein
MVAVVLEDITDVLAVVVEEFTELVAVVGRTLQRL